jgi:hypothetical protein
VLAEGMKDMDGISEDEVAAQALKETLHDDGPGDEGASSRRLWWVVLVILAVLIVLWALKKFS